jgi:Raf kinase inhibitor-like YbhB/YbcL family protein
VFSQTVQTFAPPAARAGLRTGAALVIFFTALGCGSDATGALPNASASAGQSATASSAGKSAVSADGAGTRALQPTAAGVNAGRAGSLASDDSGASAVAGGGTGVGSAGAGTAGASGSAAGGSGAAGSAGSGANAGAGGVAAGTAGVASGGSFMLTTDVLKDDEMLPKEYRCDAQSPALSWSAGPSGTQSYAIVFKDVTPGFSMNFMHWVIYDIPASVMSLPMGVKAGAAVDTPAGAKQGNNYKPVTGFSGPCATSGTNMYKFTLYALDVATLPGLSGTPMDAQVETALEGAHKLATATLTTSSMP